MARTAFLGLGVMGFHMAGHLARAGHQVTVWNRSPAKSAAWTAAHKGEAAKDPASAVFGAEYVLMCLGDDPDVRAVSVDIARAGTLPSQVTYDLLNTILNPKLVRQDHIIMSRMLDNSEQVVGSNIGGSKIGGDVDDAVVLFPEERSVSKEVFPDRLSRR